VLQGKDMSFNNWLDAYCRLRTRVGHAGGLGRDRQAQQSLWAAARGSLAESYRAAFACDMVSAFGGIVAFHGDVDA
jgi:phosphoribosylaminoimidazolecarboxamide formyltransferase/IMP cyclohydrolase